MNTRHVNLFKAYQSFWQNYFNFKGTSNRSEYWWPFLCNWLIRIILAVLGLIGYLKAEPHVQYLGWGLLIIYCLAALIPCISVTVRRYRDSGINVNWIFLTYLLPYVFQIIVHESVGKTWTKLIAENASAFLEFVCLICAVILPMFPTKRN